MEKVEQYIKDYTRNCSNELSEINNTIVGKMKVVNGYHPWFTPDHARCVAQIAREETIKEVCEWLEKEQKDSILTDTDIERLKKHFE